MLKHNDQWSGLSRLYVWVLKDVELSHDLKLPQSVGPKPVLFDKGLIGLCALLHLSAQGRMPRLPFGIRLVCKRASSQQALDVGLRIDAGFAQALHQVGVDFDGQVLFAHKTQFIKNVRQGHPGPIIFSGRTIASKSSAEMPSLIASSRSDVPFLCAVLAMLAARS